MNEIDVLMKKGLALPKPQYDQAILPPDITDLSSEDLAIMFKGKGLRTINIRPQPFLIPSYETEKPKLIQRLKKLLDVKS